MCLADIYLKCDKIRVLLIQHISKIERGETDFQWTTLEQIANAVGLSAVLVPTGLVPVVESLAKGRDGKGEEEPVPLVGSLTETEG